MVEINTEEVFKQLKKQNGERVAGNSFLESNNSVKFLNVPKLERLGYDFLRDNTTLIELKAPIVAASNEDIKRLKLVIAKNKTQQKFLKPLIARLFKKSLKTNN